MHMKSYHVSFTLHFSSFSVPLPDDLLAAIAVKNGEGGAAASINERTIAFEVVKTTMIYQSLYR
jgi:hypothetical protein